MTLGLALVSLFAVIACSGVELEKTWLVALGKPLATASLFLLLVGAPPSLLVTATRAAVLFSLIGDIALLSDGERPFMVGLVSFLVAHLCFIVGFASSGRAGPLLWSAIPAVLVVWLAFLRLLWPGLGAMRVPVVIYSGAAASMVGAASYLGGRAPAGVSLLLVGGSAAFFLSDANLGVLRFRRAYPHGPTLTLALYWLGQLGLVLGVAKFASWSAS